LVFFASFSFMLLMGGGIYIFKTQPEVLGLPPLPADSTQVAAKAKYDAELVAKREKEKQEFERRKVEEEKRKKDSLINIIYALTDSLNRARSEYGTAARKVSELSLEMSRQQQEATAKQDAAEKENYAVLARMYNAANPKDVAKILKIADAQKAATILKLMKNKVAAKVIEALPPKQAIEIMQLNGPNAPVEEVVENPKAKN